MVTIGLLSAFATAPVFAFELDRTELEETAGADIEFENYEGPVESVDTREAIRGIGDVLGRGMTESGRGNIEGRYRVTRIVGDADSPLFSADIIELDEGARVDHIDNLRRIVAGYLEAAWGYESADADLVARFATIYNAVYRGAMDLFFGRYRGEVVAALDPERAGLALSYRQWPGRTQIVLPIRDDRAPGDLDAVDTGQLVDPQVIAELRMRSDLGIEDRKAIIAFIERVIEERVEALREEQAALDEEREAVVERQREVEAEISELEGDSVADTAAEPVAEPEPQGDEAAGRDEETPPAEPAAEDEPAERADTGDDAETEERLTELRQEREELAAEEREIEERQEELDSEAEDLEELTERVAELLEETAEDQQLLETEGSEFVPFVVARGSARFELSVVDLREAAVAGERTIPVADRDLVMFQGGILVAHETTGRLLLLDAASLGVIAESDAEVVPGGSIRPIGAAILAVVPDGGRHYIGEFDAQLVLQRRSAEPVLARTDIVNRGDRLVLQDEDGTIRVLSLDELD
ncbi:MAG: hypothetical protein MI724_14380 [Spirochaetales bacterium]|nr:hypothetical protein [Spirochaetales bacterium]